MLKLKPMIKVLLRVIFFWFKERVLRIKPKLPTFVFVVIENGIIMDVFKNDIDARNYCIGIDTYKIIRKELR